MRKMLMPLMVAVSLIAAIFISGCYGVQQENNETVQACIDTGGEWVEFTDICADSCDRQQFCAQVLTMSCDCGTGRCWNQTACIDISEAGNTVNGMQTGI